MYNIQSKVEELVLGRLIAFLFCLTLYLLALYPNTYVSYCNIIVEFQEYLVRRSTLYCLSARL